ncbi:MAG: hypothetical protein AAGD22_13640 [Verrucomicrobiota bacterium]
MIAALIILLILANSGSDALRLFDPAEAKEKIVEAVKDDPARQAKVAAEVDAQIATYRKKEAEVRASEAKLLSILISPTGTRAEFQAELDSFNKDLAKYDQELLRERNAMRKLMTREEWDKAFGGVKEE